MPDKPREVKVSVNLDGEPYELTLIPKRDSRLHRWISGLFFIPDTYMTHFWTTVNQTVGVPDSAVGKKFGDADWQRWYKTVLRHEARHARRARRYTLPLYWTGYLGPSVTLGLPACLVTLLGAWWWGWWPALWALGLTAALSPLTTGFAIFRALDEWDAYRESIITYGDGRLRYVADSLWENYFYTIPPCVTRWWFRRRRPRLE